MSAEIDNNSQHSSLKTHINRLVSKILHW